MEKELEFQNFFKAYLFNKYIVKGLMLKQEPLEQRVNNTVLLNSYDLMYLLGNLHS